MNVLVTGGAGFIGSHFADLLREARPEDSLTVLDALTYAGDRRNLASDLELVEGDVADPETVDPLVAATGVVVNFAAESMVDRSIADARPFAVTNVVGTQTLLEACWHHGVPFVQVSTDEVYGSIEGGAFAEDSPLAPNNPYAATKAAADLLCRSFHRTFGMDVRVMRGPNAFGPRQHPEKAIPTFAVAALTRQPLPVYGRGLQRREWLAVEDFCRAVLVVLEAGEPGEVYNAGGGTEIGNLELARTICRLAGAPESLVSFVPDRPGHDFRYALSWDRLAALGWKPKADFEASLAAAVAWFRDHPERWSR